MMIAALVIALTGTPAKSAVMDHLTCSGAGALISAIAVGGSGLIDIVTAPASARRHNRLHVGIAPGRGKEPALRFGFSMATGKSAPRVADPPPVPAPPSPSRKSEATALLLSLASTVLPAGVGLAGEGSGWLFLGGVVIGPSVGHFYAEQYKRGSFTVALRTAAAVLGIYSIVDCFD